MPRSTPIAPLNVESKILEIRGERVMLDGNLADVYGVTTRALNQAVKRNAERFPEDFAFQLTLEEIGDLKSQSVISSSSEMFTALRALLAPSSRTKHEIGFTKKGER